MVTAFASLEKIMYLYLHVCGYACPCVHVLKPEVNIRCLSLWLFTLLFEEVSLMEPGAQAFG